MKRILSEQNLSTEPEALEDFVLNYECTASFLDQMALVLVYTNTAGILWSYGGITQWKLTRVTATNPVKTDYRYETTLTLRTAR